MSTQSLRDLVKLSINDAKAVSIEVQDDDVREVKFKKFLVEERNAVGTADNGATPVVVIFPRKELEAEYSPLVFLGQ